MPNKSLKNIKLEGKNLKYFQAMTKITFPHIKHPIELWNILIANWIERNPEFHKLILKEIHKKP